MAPARIIEDNTAETHGESFSPNKTKVGINGFGRIGRVAFRASLLRDDITVVAINHTCASVDDVIHQISFDSTHGPLSKSQNFHTGDIVAIDEQSLAVRGNVVRLISERNPANINWKALGAEYVIESTGKFTTTALAEAHTKLGGAKRVLISAPSKDASTFVFGVNHHEYPLTTPTVISCASCTTNCLAPLAKVLDEEFGIVQGLMTTVHASTRSQHVLDGYSKRDRRAGRAVLGNVIPTTTGAAKAVATVLPTLAGKLTGISLRVPICNVSLVDLTLNLEKSTSLSEIISVLETVSQTTLSGVLSVEPDELVSCDFQGNSHSCVVDVKGCVELNSRFFKILAWYDNEWAYSSRLLDMLAYMAKVDAVLPV
ncbi:glyceraldehyde-3-phosphate dehydrogenase [Phlyctema vagabunda]|uniref:Glyceraldehyde-3-phosphate dehydrogenase n=1 Tax=Phlyctema vagabunda TaxID=108571 RepID=A0ABR4P7K6_9HELO